MTDFKEVDIKQKKKVLKETKSYTVERARHNATSSHMGVGNIVSLTHLSHFYLKKKKPLQTTLENSSYKLQNINILKNVPLLKVSQQR